jgi:TonB family protein
VAARPPSRTARKPIQTTNEHETREPSAGPVAANPAPAQSTDGQNSSLRVEGANLPANWIRQLQAWWDLHAYYPPAASEHNVGGNVKMHLLIHANGVVWKDDVVESSGSKELDIASYLVFHNAHLHPFPPGTVAAEADVYITMHYVITHRHE